MGIPPVPGKKLSRQHSASKRAPAHSAAKRPVAKKVAVQEPTPQPQPAQVRAPKEHHPHRGLHRLLIGLNIFVGLCVLSAGIGYGYLKFRLGQLDKISFGCNVLRNCGSDDPGKPMNVLLVGSDTRSFVKDKSDQAQFGNENTVGGERTDTMMVLHVDPTAQKASILSIPRDLWVPIAGMGYRERINTAFGIKTTGAHAATTARQSTVTTTNALGATVTTSSAVIHDGPERLIATIRQSLDIEIDHYMEVNFAGFRSIVNAIGGVTVPFPAPARDKFSGLDVKTAGCVNLTGDQALGYVRSRHFQYFESGRWRSDPTGDIGRIQRQQDFIRRVLRKAISKGVRNPVKLNALIGAGIKNLKLDSALSTKDLLRLGKQFHSLEPEAVDMLTLPTDGFRTPAGASVLKLREDEARTIINRFNGVGQAPTTSNGPVPKIPPATVRVLVLNGTGVNGQAGQVQRQLTTAGFGVGGVGDAKSYNNPVTTIRYGAGQIQKAQLLQAYIVGGAKIVLDNTLTGGDIQLIVGAGFGGVRTSLTGTSSSTTTPSTTVTTAAGTSSRGAATLAC
ncbi:MAG TPA: LCP family protein [Acidimicrobiales bacterium]|nr:LCP family protein [Acidimicrobiales bacterium]